MILVAIVDKGTHVVVKDFDSSTPLIEVWRWAYGEINPELASLIDDKDFLPYPIQAKLTIQYLKDRS